MQRILLIAALAALAVTSVSTRGVPSNMGMDHVGFTVRNVTAAADFLIEVFDCSFDWEVKRQSTPNAGERGWDKIFDINPSAYMPHVVMLKCGDYHLTQYIELFEWVSPDQVVPAEGRKWLKFSDLGHGYISFTVKDIHAVVAHIKSLNIEGVRIVQDPPMNFPLRGEICTSTFIVSPWGQWIELSQWSISGPRGQTIRALREDTNPEQCIINSVGESSCQKQAPPKECMMKELHSIHCSSPANTREFKKFPEIGFKIEDIETPAFLVDLDAFEHNIGLMKERMEKAGGVDWRPPVKAHKSPALAHQLIRHGAKGILVLKISEAEVFAENGIDDIYIANILIDHFKIRRLAQLAKKIKRVRIHVDNEANLKEIAAAATSLSVQIEVLVEINIGHNRTGVHPHQAARLAQAVVDAEGVTFVGLTGYEGHTPVLEPAAKTAETNNAHSKLAEAKKLVEAAGIKVQVMSGGGSCNYVDALNTGALNELQAGGGAIVDNLYAHKAHLANHGHRIGAFILTQVVSVPEEKDRAMADAGFKSVGWHPFGGLPVIHNRDDLEVAGLSAEHLKLKGKDGKPVELAAGEKLLVIPGYGDAMGMLHRRIYAVRNGVVEDVWPILAAGSLQ